MYSEITPTEVEERLSNSEKLNLIDVREDDEWESGHIAEAISIPLSLFGERYEELPKEEALILVCRSGARSGRACDFLHAQGYKVANMTGGMLAWNGEVAYGK
ncbi:rhodanese-like domain-containing protein [Paenibacillus glycanilyticus]|uniref:Rhodanese-like domain-containing protein n=1 Tax=Paenibacillus glycanilyticus TaxID=126569 RepID=A0ABQ6GKL3_9BACL|nr:rhodanese-like domain-containing protein [Paenibacillus glycanilyticus]GLX70778.1 rhodanese-like domain-containing protein [Paenibacillus glycanilyticus]